MLSTFNAKQIYLRTGDALVVWKLDLLARSVKQLIETVEGVEAQGIGFCSLTEAIDTTTAGGKLVFHIFGALAEFERSIIRERTPAGLDAAKARGRRGGWPSDYLAEVSVEPLVAGTSGAPGIPALDRPGFRTGLNRLLAAIAATGARFFLRQLLS